MVNTIKPQTVWTILYPGQRRIDKGRLYDLYATAWSDCVNKFMWHTYQETGTWPTRTRAAARKAGYRVVKVRMEVVED
jgi:hypothetical protein